MNKHKSPSTLRFHIVARCQVDVVRLPRRGRPWRCPRGPCCWPRSPGPACSRRPTCPTRTGCRSRSGSTPARRRPRGSRPCWWRAGPGGERRGITTRNSTWLEHERYLVNSGFISCYNEKLSRMFICNGAILALMSVLRFIEEAPPSQSTCLLQV